MGKLIDEAPNPLIETATTIPILTNNNEEKLSINIPKNTGKTNMEAGLKQPTNDSPQKITIPEPQSVNEQFINVPSPIINASPQMGGALLDDASPLMMMDAPIMMSDSDNGNGGFAMTQMANIPQGSGSTKRRQYIPPGGGGPGGFGPARPFAAPSPPPSGGTCPSGDPSLPIECDPKRPWPQCPPQSYCYATNTVDIGPYFCCPICK